MSKTQLFDSDLAQYSLAARAVLDLKKAAPRLGDLTLYTAAVGSALALAPVAEASIIYSGIQNITVNRVANGTSFAPVDLNFDGQGDMSFGISGFSATFPGVTLPLQIDSAVAYGLSGTVPGAYGSAGFFNTSFGSSLLKFSASSRTIGSNYGANTTFSFSGVLRGHLNFFGVERSYGSWNPASGASTTGFAGVVIDPYKPPGPQFGWLHFKLTTDSQNRTDSLTLIDWAFESVPGAGIHVGAQGTAPGPAPAPIPEPSTLSLLALGATGLAALRRRRGPGKKADRVN